MSNLLRVYKMDENINNQQKPLRRSSNKIKDIYDAYVKNDKTKNITINDADVENDMHHSDDNTNEQNTSANSSIDEAAFLEMHSRIEELTRALNESEVTIVNLQKESNELKELSLRKTAELENFRRRSIKEKSDIIDYANQRLLTSFVEILDDLTAAISSSGDLDSMKKGMELIFSKAKKLFDDAGVTVIGINENTSFDVDFHEALMMAPSDKPEGTILQILQNGYMLKDKVLRHAKVITSSGTANN